MLRRIQQWIRHVLIGPELPPVKVDVHVTITSRPGDEFVVKGCRDEERERRVIVKAIKTAKINREI